MDKTEALNIVQKFTKLVQNSYDCKQVFLFGSYAKGTNSVESDIDVAVILDEFENKMDIQLELMKLRRKIDSRIEPHPFREKEFNITNPIVYDILEFGHRVYINKN